MSWVLCAGCVREAFGEGGSGEQGLLTHVHWASHIERRASSCLSGCGRSSHTYQQTLVRRAGTQATESRLTSAAGAPPTAGVSRSPTMASVRACARAWFRRAPTSAESSRDPPAIAASSRGSSRQWRRAPTSAAGSLHGYRGTSSTRPRSVALQVRRRFGPDDGVSAQLAARGRGGARTQRRRRRSQGSAR